MSKCHCGYECRLPGEQEMLDQYDCARTIVRKEGPFQSMTVIQCDRNGKGPEVGPVDNGQSFADKFKEKYQPSKQEDKP